MLSLLLFLVSAQDCEFFECKDSTRVIPANFLNDNFCDCPDGSDETSTSACLVGSFRCPEKSIHSTWVNDGVCDCCDGSDEKTGLCPNTCQEFYKSQQASEKSEFDKWQKGIKSKIEQVVLGTSMVNSFSEDLKKLDQDIKDLDHSLAGLQALKSKGEEMGLSIDLASTTIENLNEDRRVKEESKSKIEKVKDSDFGKFKEFATLVGKHLEIEMGKYTYVIEFFSRAYQKEGSMEYSLGNWAGFEDDYSVMRFTGGTMCPNQVGRSLKVHLKCSDRLEFYDFKEVSMCTYEATVSLSSVCKLSTIIP